MRQNKACKHQKGSKDVLVDSFFSLWESVLDFGMVLRRTHINPWVVVHSCCSKHTRLGRNKHTERVHNKTSGVGGEWWKKRDWVGYIIKSDQIRSNRNRSDRSVNWIPRTRLMRCYWTWDGVVIIAYTWVCLASGDGWVDSKTFLGPVPASLSVPEPYSRLSHI